ncbi:MAG: GNAT family protein [Pseudomonadota bacterium]
MLLRGVRPDASSIRLFDGPVMLRFGDVSDIAAWIALREASKAHLSRWEPTWSKADIAPAAVRRRMRRQEQSIRAGRAAPFFVFERPARDAAARHDDYQPKPPRLVGGVTLSDIKRDVVQSAQIGYWIGAAYLHQGFGAAAVAAAARYGIEALSLNRIEAACQPENIASRRLLERLGFRQEGLARDYLHINGAWRDHCLYAVTARDVETGAALAGAVDDQKSDPCAPAFNHDAD